MSKAIRGSVSVLLAVCVLLALFTGAVCADAPEPFPDVPERAWYANALQKIRTYTTGIINGIRDEDGVLRFHPGDTVHRGEFLKMSMTAAGGYTMDHSRDGVHWAAQYYTIALENGVLVADPEAGGEPMFPCTAEALNQVISRYEMAVILANACTLMQKEETVTLWGAETHIADYEDISTYAPANGTSGAGSYLTAVEQAYGKGLLKGYDDGSFHGDATLTRAEAVAVIYRQMNWKGSRNPPEWATEPVQSFAQWLQDGHIDGWGNLDSEARLRLFGDANKTHFYSAADAEPYMSTIYIPIWTYDMTGNKYSTQMQITVNKQVETEVLCIFQQIFNDPERFPIYSYCVGCARYTDTMRHSWGCAIDINPIYNCECNFRPGYQYVTCGDGWWPYDMEGKTWVGRDASAYHGSLSGPSPYSIKPGGSVVRAFADYGWGWGGSGNNNPDIEARGWGGTSFDFMHFSVLPSGG